MSGFCLYWRRAGLHPAGTIISRHRTLDAARRRLASPRYNGVRSVMALGTADDAAALRAITAASNDPGKPLAPRQESYRRD